MKIVIGLMALFAIGFVFQCYDPLSKCPMSLRFEFETECNVKDERSGTKLVELFNASQDTLWLAKVKGAEILWLEHPVKRVESYKSHIPENEIKFADDTLSLLLVNGTPFDAQILSSRPPPGSN